jgi:hypothetical protein
VSVVQSVPRIEAAVHDPAAEGPGQASQASSDLLSLRSRVGKLEHAPRRPGICEMCGVDPTAPKRYEVHFGDEAPDDDIAVSSEACRHCGYRRWTVLNWDGELITDPEQVRAERERLRELEERRREYLRMRPDLTEDKDDVPDYPPNSWDEGGGQSL